MQVGSQCPTVLVPLSAEILSENMKVKTATACFTSKPSLVQSAAPMIKDIPSHSNGSIIAKSRRVERPRSVTEYSQLALFPNCLLVLNPGGFEPATLRPG